WARAPRGTRSRPRTGSTGATPASTTAGRVAPGGRTTTSPGRWAPGGTTATPHPGGRRARGPPEPAPTTSTNSPRPPPSLRAATYHSSPGTVAGRFTSPCSAQCGGSPAMVLTNTTTPTLSGSALDPDGAQVRLDFEVWNSTGTVQVTGGSVPNVPSNSPGYW